jgi:predicted component of type VI protein secretion system
LKYYRLVFLRTAFADVAFGFTLSVLTAVLPALLAAGLAVFLTDLLGFFTTFFSAFLFCVPWQGAQVPWVPSPTRQLSLQPEAPRASQEVTNDLKHFGKTTL